MALPSGTISRPVPAIFVPTDATIQSEVATSSRVSADSFFLDAADAEPLCEVGDVVHLKVGDSRLTTTLATLCKDPTSKLCSMFSGKAELQRDVDGTVCLDSDGLAFRYILDFLRDGYVPLSLSTSMRLTLLREARKFGLGLLHEKLGGLQNPCGTAPVIDFTPLAEPLRRSLPTANRRMAPFSCRSEVSAPPNLSRPLRDLSRPKKPSEPILYSSLFPVAHRMDRKFVRLRYGHEYSGDWIVSSPRNLPGVEYEMHSACLARTPVEAMNRMSKVGFQPYESPPRLPSVSNVYTDKWVILMYKDCDRDMHQDFPHTVSSGSCAAPNVAAAVTSTV